jgi:N-acetyl-anhydromuramyl-L-alanine amidase AmpD
VVINKTEYKLTEDNYFKKEFQKRVIILGNSFSMNMKHYIGWKLRNNGQHKNTAPYTIDIHGEIFEHFNPKYYSKFLNFETIDKVAIPIIIENEGYLVKDGENYKDFIGRKYFREVSDIEEKKWRTHTYWAPYTKEQLESAISLVNELRTKFDIGGVVMGHNTKDDDIYNINGVTYRSNYNSCFTDINPTWDFKEFKERLDK